MLQVNLYITVGSNYILLAYIYKSLIYNYMLGIFLEIYKHQTQNSIIFSSDSIYIWNRFIYFFTCYSIYIQRKHRIYFWNYVYSRTRCHFVKQKYEKIVIIIIVVAFEQRLHPTAFTKIMIEYTFFKVHNFMLLHDNNNDLK